MSQINWGDIEIRVTPQELINKAEEVDDKIRILDKALSDLEDEVRSTQSFWLGEAGDIFRQTYLSQKPEINEMLKRLREHPKDLLLISGNYQKAEETIMEEVAVLDTNAIEW